LKRKELFRGRLKEGQDKDISSYLSSLREDKDLFDIELDVLSAHALTLERAGVIDASTLRAILKALNSARTDKKLRKKIEMSLFVDSPEFYDIHPAIENYLIKKIGMDKGGYINLGKSRNDHIVADIRIFMREKFLSFYFLSLSLLKTILKKAKENFKTPFIAFTHSQPAQITTFGYFLLSHAYPIIRALESGPLFFDQLNLSPMGACAVAGTGVPLEREWTARLLGFNGIIKNAIDAVSSRDFFLFSSFPMLEVMLSLSRLASDIIYLSSMGYGLIELPDSLTDTSSAMPQKKNASPMELLRARTDEAISIFACMGNIIAGRISGYNQDFQELKVLWWRFSELVLSSIPVAEKYISSMSINLEKVKREIYQYFVQAIDLAEVLSLKYKIPFRLSHRITGVLVMNLIKEGKDFADIKKEDIESAVKEVSGQKIDFEDMDIFDIEKNLKIKERFYSEKIFVSELKELLKRVRKLEREILKRKRHIETAQYNLKNMQKAGK